MFTLTKNDKDRSGCLRMEVVVNAIFNFAIACLTEPLGYILAIMCRMNNVPHKMVLNICEPQ